VTLGKMTFSIITLSKIYETLNITTFSIVILSTSIRTMTLSTTRLSIITPKTIIKNTTLSIIIRYAEYHVFICMLGVVMRTVVRPSVLAPHKATSNSPAPLS
jgi:hypothetical protein